MEESEIKESDIEQSLASQAEAFVKTVERELQAIEAMQSSIEHDSSDSHSFASSISSRIDDQDGIVQATAKRNLMDDLQNNFQETSLSTVTDHITNTNFPATIEELHKARTVLSDSINILGRHVPGCVVRDLTLEALDISKDQNQLRHKLVMPHSQHYQAALLFVDMSGFTKLAQLLDLESLSRVINSFFQQIVDEVTNHGGDVLKFAGDAVFAEWRIHTDDCENVKEEQDEIYKCLLEGATCGADVVSKCSDYPVFTNEGIQISTLNVHCGIAFGQMAGVHVGNDYNRREFVILGETIDQVTKACDAATYGELMASPEAYEILQRGIPQSQVDSFSKGDEEKVDRSKPILIASRNETLFEKKWSKNRRRDSLSAKKNEFVVPYDTMDLTSLKYLQKLLSFYAHPVVVSEEMNRQTTQRRRSTIPDAILERHRSEAELRSVYTLFIQTKVDADLSDDSESNHKVFKLLNDILNLVTSVLDTYRGHLRQFILDDKGVILIATFGLRGSTSPNMAVESVLPASRAIHYTLQNDLGVDNNISVTLGKVYCGVVGGIKRHEFAVLGPAVNLSARLLSMQNHPGLLINNDVRREAMKWGTFLSFPPMIAKGYADPVSVFQPMTATEARWGRVNPMFVGRKNEIGRSCQIAQDIATMKGESKMFFVWGETGAGKSDFLVQAIASMRKRLATMKKSVIVTRNVGNDGDALVPFSVFRTIFRDLLSDKDNSDNASLHSKISKQNGLGSLRDDLDNLSLASGSTMNTMKSNSRERLIEICNELGAPRGFLQIVGYHLLGHSDTYVDHNQQAPIFDEIINFMAKVFIHCTSSADITIVALDDMHNTDNSSWKVIQKIYETGAGIYFVCSSRPFRVGSISNVDDDFWLYLKGSQKDCGRFEELDLVPLNQREIAKMASLLFTCRSKEIDSQFIKDIYDYTRGMPHFTFQALQNCQRKGLHHRLENNKIGWRHDVSEAKMFFSSLDELLLQRIDELDEFTRKTLHLASVLGKTFSLMEIIGISEHVSSIVEDGRKSHTDKLRRSLDVAVEEGILDEYLPDKVDDSPFHVDNFYIRATSEAKGEVVDTKIHDVLQQEDLYFTFSHDTWRQKILSLLLDAYKQDIHKHAASSLEAKIPDIIMADYRTKMRLFAHLKGSGNCFKAADLAVNIGKGFVYLGLNRQSIRVYDEALDMWRKNIDNNCDNCCGLSSSECIAGISPEMVELLDESDLTSVVKLLTASGQALGTLSKKEESARAFEDALDIFKLSPVSDNIKDRSFIFPIYSGLFFLLKYGGLIDPSEALEYEDHLVSNFVNETRLHGDPVHYSRALAMQGEFFSRQGKYEEALICHEKLKRVYDVKLHSALVVDAYASDRSAQNLGNGANCLYRLGRVKEALELTKIILDDVMPQMDLKNVHNSMIMIYPVLWILKNEKMYGKALSTLERYVFEPFNEHFGKDGKTFSLPMFEPLKALFSILMYMEGEVESLDDTLIERALEPDSLYINAAVDNSMANFARSGSSISAEVCLLLSRLTSDDSVSKQLIEKGWKLAQIAMKLANSCGDHQTTYIETKPVYDELSKLVVGG